MAVADDVLQTLAPEPYEKVRGQVQDGDLPLCSAHDPFSRLIRWATKSPWSHVAVAFRVSSIDRVLVLEAVEKIGVRAVPLSTFISRNSAGVTPYPGHIVLARHGQFGPDARARMHRMSDFAFSRLGDRFAQAEILKIMLRIVLGRLDIRLPPSLGPDDEFICSEYVARCYESVGLPVPWDGLGFIAPADIAADPAVSAVAQIQTR